MNNLLYDVKLSNGEVVEGCYFVKYKVPIKGKGSLVAYYVDKCIKVFDRFGNEIVDKNFDDFVVIKVYDENTHNELTDDILKKYTDYTNLGIYWFIREVKIEE